MQSTASICVVLLLCVGMEWNVPRGVDIMRITWMLVNTHAGVSTSTAISMVDNATSLELLIQ